MLLTIAVRNRTAGEATAYNRGELRLAHSTPGGALR